MSAIGTANGRFVHGVPQGCGATLAPGAFSNPLLASWQMPVIMAGMFGCKHGRCAMRRKTNGDPNSVEIPPGGDPGAAGDFPDPRAVVDLREAAATFRLTTGETLADASETRQLVLVFLRHFGCTFTRQILRGLEVLQQSAHRHGADLVLVHMLRSGEEIRYLAGHDRTVRIADPNRQLYRAFGLKKGGLHELLGWHVWRMGIISIFKGCGVGHLAGDGRQMPGVFLFHRGAIIGAQRAKTAADMPDLPRLFDSLETARPAPIQNAHDTP